FRAFAHSNVLVLVNLSTLLRQTSQALFFPQTCVLCDQWVLNRDFSPLCPTCRLSLREHSQSICYYCGIPLPGSISEIQETCSVCKAGTTPFDFARSYGPYAGNLRKVIWKFKFGGCRHLVHPLSAILESSLSHGTLHASPSWIVPVPAHPSRKRTRGIDQTALLSRALSRRSGIPVFSGLRRVKPTQPQSGLNVQQRLKNLQKAFRLSGELQLADRDILIVDDIWTTGVTVAEVCRLLRRQTDAEKIIVVTLARVSRRHP
ncbi:MAG: ComF family protein, partial [Acidobacteriota bacterium]